MKLHYLDAEMDETSVPAILAYKGGDLFANLVSVIDEIPAGRDLSVSSLESVLQSYVSLILGSTCQQTQRTDIWNRYKVLN